MSDQMKTVLHAEDDKLYADIIRKALEADGFFVVTVGSGEDALTAAQAKAPDLILLDIGLPRMDGFEVLEKLKADEKTRGVPVIMLSRLSSKEDVDPCFETGCAEYMIKTQHSPEDVAHHVRRILREAAGFTLSEALIVGAVILLAAGFLFWQLSHPRIPAPAPQGNVPLEGAR